MDYKIWLHQSLPKAVHRTLKMGFRPSVHTDKKPGISSDCAPNEMIQGLWNFNSPMGPFDDPALHKALDRVMARIRLS